MKQCLVTLLIHAKDFILLISRDFSTFNARWFTQQTIEYKLLDPILGFFATYIELILSGFLSHKNHLINLRPISPPRKHTPSPTRQLHIMNPAQFPLLRKSSIHLHKVGTIRIRTKHRLMLQTRLRPLVYVGLTLFVFALMRLFGLS